MSTDFLHGTEVLQIDNGSRPLQTARSSIIGMIGTAPDADPSVFPLNEPVLIANQPHKARALDPDGAGRGTLADAFDDVNDQAGAVSIVVRVEEGVDLESTISNIIGDSTAMTGIHAFKAAQSEFGFTPRIYTASGFTSQRLGGPKNPVIAELEGLLGRHRAIAIADGPSTTDEDAFAYANALGNDRVYLVDPACKVWDKNINGWISRPASARVAGVIARTDNERGFWWSPSNKKIYGIGGTSRPIEYATSDSTVQSNLLNEKKIATIINKDGYRLWGNRSLSSDPKWAFLSVRRTADIVYDTIEEGQFWAQDRPFSAQLLDDVQETVQDYLDSLTARKALLGGGIWIDRELNTATTLESGQFFFDFDFEPPAPAERFTFRAHRNNGYYTELVNSLT